MSNGTSMSDDDSFVLMMFAATWGLPMAIAYFTRDRLTGWLVEHRLLLPAADRPLVEVPGTSAGLDLARLVIAAGLLAALLVATVCALRRPRRDALDDDSRSRR